MDAGVERIVDQVVNPKIRSLVEPEVKRIINAYLGEENMDDEGELKIPKINAPHPLFKCLPTTTEEEALPPNGEAEEGDEQRKDEKMSEKLSNISSEDIEMASAKEDSDGEEGGKGQRTPGKIHVR